MHLNTDIWQEIINYFEHPADYYTLKCLALTSRTLSSIALDAMWRDGERFLKIISVINSFANSPDGPFLELEYVRFNGSGSEKNGESGGNDAGSRKFVTESEPIEVAWVSSYLVLRSLLED